MPSETTEPNKFIHSAAYRGDQNCAQCHAANQGKQWSGNKFDHLDFQGVMMNVCKQCHHDLRLSKHDGGEVKDATKACVSCHSLSQQRAGPGTPAEMTWNQSASPQTEARTADSRTHAAGADSRTQSDAGSGRANCPSTNPLRFFV